MAKKVAVKEVEVKVEAKAENAGGKRFSSWKAKLIYHDKGIDIDVPIRYKKLDATKVDKELNIVYKTKEGSEAKFKYITEDGKVIVGEDIGFFTDASDKTKYTTQTKKWITKDGNVVFDGVQSYQVDENGKEIAVDKLKKSDAFVVVTTKPNAEYDEWLPEHTYTIWGETDNDVYALSKFANHLHEKNEFAVIMVTLSSNTFHDYYGLIRPVMRGGQFGITMKCSRLKINFAEYGLMNYLDKQPAIVEVANKAKTKKDKLV